MNILSLPHYELKTHYPIIVIGSGYGGAILASRLARSQNEVCLLERGKEFLVGEYPNNEFEALKNLQIDGLDNKHYGSRSGLYHIYYDQEMSVFVGCGLGGTSLVNANVALRADTRVFANPCWPKALVDDLNTTVESGYQEAETMLKPTPYPEDFPALPKMQSLQQSAAALKQNFYRPPINVNFKEGINHVGVLQHPCQLCGDCVSGCNYAAKNTLIMNYLPDAKNNGAHIFTQMEVHSIAKQNGRFIVYYYDLSLRDKKASQQLRFITTDLVILSGGTIGTTEILLRSKAAGLKMSDQVGHHFTGNGDVLAFGYKITEPVYGVGYGSESPQGKQPVGPCITGIIDMRDTPQLNEGMVIEEGAIPGGFATFLPKVFALSAATIGVRPDASSMTSQNKDAAAMHNIHSAMSHTQTFLVMSHDDAGGELYLNDNEIHIRWPGVGAQPHFAKINAVLQNATTAVGGTFIPNPIWSEASEHTLVTVHPLGGAVMADDAARGVVNHKGQVFCNSSGDDVYENFYVCDGSIMPRSLGVNPLLTISALAERCAALIAKDRGWKINYTLPSFPQKESESKKVGLIFTETMRGRLSKTQLTNYEDAYAAADFSPFEFTLTIRTDDLDKMLADKDHAAKITGTVTISALSKMPLMVTDGQFQLFVEDEQGVGRRRMIYQLTLESVEGNRYAFEGYKLIRNDPGLDVWKDTTTLYVDIYDLQAEKRLCAKGILKILIPDFIQQLTTIRVLNTEDPAVILAAKARFGSFFAGVLYQTYGGIFAKTVFFNPDSPPREKRKLRTSPPEVYFITTKDQQTLRLTRYKGGDKGPVMLSHGLGVSSSIFSIDTIETNLLEYLYAHEYDVWLFDYRASIDLPVANTEFSADEIALYDYPAAVSKVLEITNASDVQMVAHCFGATTLCMSMLSGLKGVRSILFSQIAAHMIVPYAAKIKAGLYLPSFLDKLGLSTLTAYAAQNENWHEKLFDESLKFVPVAGEERCDSAVCHRITFLYGQLYEHDQLNQSTHDALHEMFGVANLKSFEHLALMIRKGHVVTAEAQENYLPHFDKLALPITFIHGEENQCFLPESTAITLELLSTTNGPDFYQRYVIPNYGHIDCIFGKNAVNDVYPLILEHLEKNATGSKKQSLGKRTEPSLK